MRKIFIAMLLGGMLVAFNNKQNTNNDMKHELELTQEWDKVFPLSKKVNHQKVTFKTQYGLTGLWSLWCREGAVQWTLCHEDGRAWFRGTGFRPFLYG